MTKNDGGPAFPSHGTMGEVTFEGMSLRAWLAGQVLGGLVTDPKHILSADSYAALSYGIADAMLKEREKNGN